MADASRESQLTEWRDVLSQEPNAAEIRLKVVETLLDRIQEELLSELKALRNANVGLNTERLRKGDRIVELQSLVQDVSEDRARWRSRAETAEAKLKELTTGRKDYDAFSEKSLLMAVNQKADVLVERLLGGGT